MCIVSTDAAYDYFMVVIVSTHGARTSALTLGQTGVHLRAKELSYEKEFLFHTHSPV